MDFKELWLEDGTAVSVLDIVDKATGILIGSYAIDVTRESGQRRRKVHWREVQAVLRLAFQAWGMPERIQTDKELVFEGHPADLYPSRFQQWLAGLGIGFERTRPGRPQDQGRVERGHRTLSDFVCSQEERQDLAHFQTALTRNRHLYNHKYPSRAKGCNGQPPLVAHPQALIPRRPYRPEEEWHLFSLDRVAQRLAQLKLTRKVSRAGQISLGGRLYYIGPTYGGQQVQLRFDPATYTWVVSTQEGETIKRLRPEHFSKSDFLNRYPVVAPASLSAEETRLASPSITGEQEAGQRSLGWLLLALGLMLLGGSAQRLNGVWKTIAPHGASGAMHFTSRFDQPARLALLWDVAPSVRPPSHPDSGEPRPP